MKNLSYGLLALFLVLAIVGICTQHGQTTTITLLSIAPLLIYVVVAAIYWALLATRK